MAQTNRSIPTSSPAAPASSHTRLIQVVEALVRRTSREPWGVRELAAELSESRSTINRILASLVEIDLASEAGLGKYSVGPRIDVLTRALSDSSVLLGRSGELLGVLADASKYTALLSVYCPRSRGYFIAACSEANATLTFRPQLGVVYPLSFGDIGREFTKYLDTTESRSTPLEEKGDVDYIFRTDDALGQLSESEFPSAVSISVGSTANGLVFSVSLHSAGYSYPMVQQPLDTEVQRVIELIIADAESKYAQTIQAYSCVSVKDDKSTVNRLERLLLLACAFPAGLMTSAHVHDHLLCNAATAKRLIQSAVEAELVIVSESTLFAGPRLYQWAARMNTAHRNLADITKKLLSSLVQETGETIALLSFDEMTEKAEFLDVIQGWRPIQYKLQVHVDVPLYAGAAGKAVLAHCDPRLVDTLNLVKITDATITSREALKEELLTTKRRGWATGEGERVLGAFGLAVPFFVDGKIRGSISATIPQYRKDERDLPTLINLMRITTGKIERLLSLGIKAEQ
ncbi:helix-turn-helix domain-containing protein [Pseudomonas cannabina pv. alisalensis]|uniref:Helix-turn-helix domain-containing protein n=3 Tax=Pseudomonas TaxID=286 RepID=A0ABS1XKW0_PSEC1|nr:helix-turn-helix domain-containing protein [Pseudomonas cannabina pv. alisalensis]QQN24454.1 helix-turn-helix domain-containing protein [Pseudomonas cannabina pv. alisalensis]